MPHALPELPQFFELDPATEELHGLSGRAAFVPSLADLVARLHPEDRAGLIQTIGSVRTDVPARLQAEFRLARRDGQVLPVALNASAVGGTGAPRFLCVLTDNSAKLAAAERFNLAMSAAGEMIFILDFDSGVHWWSAAFTRVFGHQPITTPDVVERWFDLVHPADQPRIRATHTAARESLAETWTDEYRLRRHDGSYARVIDRAQFIRRPDGSVALSISTLSDVTRLREVTDLWRQTSDAAQDVIYSHDLAAGTLWLNEAFSDRYGHDARPFAHDPCRWAELLLPADRDAFVAACEAAVRGTQTRFELRYRLRSADGTYSQVIDRARILRDECGQALRIVGTVVDVTALEDEAERTRAVVEVAANAVYDYDVAADTFYYSDGMEHTFGHDWAGPQPAMRLWVDLLHPDDRAPTEAGFLRFLAGSERYARLEYRFARKDGTWARVCERMIALRDDQGKALRVIGGIEDVTAEHETQERLRQNQRLEAIGRLTGGVAHDFNNLLTVIIGSANLLEGDAALGAEQRDLTRQMGLAARRGAELTSGLLSFARQQPLAPRPLDLVAVFAEMQGLLRRTLPAFITLDTALPPDLWLVEADPARLNAALLNLCVNAADAMPQGGRITLKGCNWVSDAARVLADPEARPGEFLRLDISDTGQGMSPEVVSRAFDPFFTTKPLGKGSGLGLSMVWGFAKQSGGHASIASVPGQGTTVTMFLPRSRAQVPAAPQPAPPSLMIRGQGQHVLVVEDDPVLRRFVVSLIERLNYRASQAENGEAALKILRRLPDIQLLFTDIVMPGHMSGRDLGLRAQAEFPGLRVLFTSGYSEGMIIHDGKLDEDVHFLAKPYQMRDLGEKLMAVLQASAAPRLHPERARLSR